MSNKTRLQTNNINLQVLIDKANALPDAGGGSSGGSASYDTCTLQINNLSGNPYQLAYTSVENGKIVAKYSNTSTSTSIICLCGSALHFYTYGSLVSSSITELGHAQSGAYRIDASANETIIATIYNSSNSGGGAN